MFEVYNIIAYPTCALMSSLQNLLYWQWILLTTVSFSNNVCHYNMFFFFFHLCSNCIQHTVCLLPEVNCNAKLLVLKAWEQTGEGMLTTYVCNLCLMNDKLLYSSLSQICLRCVSFLKNLLFLGLIAFLSDVVMCCT